MGNTTNMIGILTIEFTTFVLGYEDNQRMKGYLTAMVTVT